MLTPAGSAGTGTTIPIAGSTTVGGAGNKALSPDEPVTGAGDDAGGIPIEVCGDGKVTGEERCDTAINEGSPGACPTSCPPLESECTARALRGSDCLAECVRVAGGLGCKGGDGCCPAECTHASDSDCSEKCGDGIIQKDSGETCEPGGATACITNPDACDDNDPCTTDTLVGTPDHCNTACRHTAITTAQSGDGCCPPSATGATDSDCPANCGNGIREGNEVCDGEPGCDACRVLLTPDQQRCLGSAVDACERCACLRCAQYELSCRLTPNENFNRVCKSMLTCSTANSCADSTYCYCGMNATCTGSNLGPCKAVIDDATGGETWVAATLQAADKTTTVGRAYDADDCRVKQCKDDCR